MYRRFAPCLLSIFVTLICTQTGAAQKAAIEETTELKAGLAVIIADDVDQAYSLAGNGRWLVHLLTTQADRVKMLRAAIQKRRLGGRVVVSALAADGHLPHPDRFVNLLVVDLDALKDKAPPRQELLRVLAVRGTAVLKEKQRWQTIAAPQNERLDDWTHRFYNAGGNCVSQDRVAGYPRAVQWRDFSLISKWINSAVSDCGRQN